MITIFVGMHIEKLDGDTSIFSKYLSRNPTPGSIVMFRPERDLHPAVAVDKIAEEKLWKYGEDGKDLIMTTHSSEIVNYIGVLVYHRVIPTHQVQIVLLDEENGKPETVATFDDEGVLKNWPFGWFQPDMRHFTETPVK